MVAAVAGRDAELAPYFADPDFVQPGKGLSVSDLFVQSSDRADLIPAAAADINEQIKSQIAALNSKYVGVVQAMKSLSLSARQWTPLADDADLALRTADAARARGLALLTTSLTGVEKRAHDLAGIRRVSAAGVTVRKAPPIAKSSAEVSAQRSTSLAFRGHVPSGAAASMLASMGPGEPFLTSGLAAASIGTASATTGAAGEDPPPSRATRKRHRNDPSLLGLPPTSEAVAELRADVRELEARLRAKLKTALSTILAKERDIANLREQCDELRSEFDHRKSSARTEGDTAGAARAYFDCEARALAVAGSTWYTKEIGKPIREALTELASGFKRLGQSTT